jgi:hypothetical protein
MTSSVEVSIQAVSPESIFGAGAAAGAAGAASAAAGAAAAAAGAAAAGAAGAAAAGAEAAGASAVAAAGVCAKPVVPAASTLKPSARETSSFFIIVVLSGLDSVRGLRGLFRRCGCGRPARGCRQNLAVADLAGACRTLDGFDHAIDEVVGDGRLDLHLGQEVDHVLRAAVQLGVALLATEALDLGDGDPLHTDGRQCFAHFVELERFDDGCDQLHDELLLWMEMKWRGSLGHASL